MAAFATPATVPARAGVGFKLQHGKDILADTGAVGFVEIHAENFMGDGGPPHQLLRQVRDEIPVSLHGVGLSIGADGPLDQEHLARLVGVAKQYEPGLVSEHLAWSPHEGAYFNDLLSDDVVHALDELQEDFRNVVVLCDIEGLSYKEIADVVGCPVGTVMSRLYRGRRLLEDKLGGLAGEQGIVRPKEDSEDEAARGAVLDLKAYRRRRTG